MGGVRFHDADAFILFCVPEPGCDLSYLVTTYTCFERTAVPSYDVVAGCLGRAVRAGAMPLPVNGQYHLTPEWYNRIHRRDKEFTASEYAAMELADALEAQEWPSVGAEYLLSKADFQQAADDTGQYLDRLFAPYKSKTEPGASTQHPPNEAVNLTRRRWWIKVSAWLSKARSLIAGKLP